jgi:hypothetical protein
VKAAALAALLLLPALQPAHAQTDEDVLPVVVTWYTATGSPTYSGEWPAPGTAACSWNLPLGSLVELEDGVTYRCIDRGALGSDGWIDRYCDAAPCWEPSPQSARVLRWGGS